ncbi:MAG: lysostaphin resistance A-like protein, partial [Candidatus Anammoxibacter sp.]
MEFYKKFTIIFLLILFISCILGSLLKVPIDMWVERSSGFAHMADYKDGMYNYGKIMRRILMIVTVSALVISRKSLGIVQLVTDGFRYRQGCTREIVIGFIVGASSLLIYGVFTFILGVQHPENNPPTNSELIIKPLTYLLSACIIGLFEETIFRCILLKGLMKDLSITVSIISASLFYAILHFFSFKVMVYPGFQPFVGFTTILRFFVSHIFDIEMILPYIIGLFIVGAVLALSNIHTGKLYLPIGLHAGWVFGIKLNRF